MRSVAKLATIALDDVTPSTSYEASRTATGVRWSKRLSPDDYSIWLVVSELDDGAELAWEGEHGDDGVYVVAGELDVDGHRCPADASTRPAPASRYPPTSGTRSRAGPTAWRSSTTAATCRCRATAATSPPSSRAASSAAASPSTTSAERASAPKAPRAES